MVEHDIQLCGLLPDQAKPTILRRTDQDFIAAILAELTATEFPDPLDTTVAQPEGTPPRLKLYQPVHKTFYVALLDASCEFDGNPRVDPKWIEGSGLVVRRALLGKDAKVNKYLGWMRENNSLLGWTGFDKLEERSSGILKLDLDPDPDFRPPQVDYGHRVLNDIENSNASLKSEVFSPLFVAPPEVAEATGKTILYGVIPVTSSEVSEGQPVLPKNLSKQLDLMIPSFLRDSSWRKAAYCGKRLTWKHAAGKVPKSTSWTDECKTSLETFIKELRMFVMGLDVFGDLAASKYLVKELNKIRFHTGASTSTPAGDFLEEASDILLALDGKGETNPPSITMPLHWHGISVSDAENVRNAACETLKNRMTQYSVGRKRFDDPASCYCVRGFIRVRREEDCPLKTCWSEPSDLFSIAPWYETGDVPPLRIDLPDVFDRTFLKKLKPNVAFAMPGNVFQTLEKMDAETLWKGDGAKEQEDPNFDWICGFNIPIITFCAFIILYIIISLLNIVFWWLPFVKICIPFPKRG